MHVLSCCQKKQSVAANTAIAELQSAVRGAYKRHTRGVDEQHILCTGQQVLVSQEFIRAPAAQSKSSDLTHPEHGSAISPNVMKHKRPDFRVLIAMPKEMQETLTVPD